MGSRSPALLSDELLLTLGQVGALASLLRAMLFVVTGGLGPHEARTR